jgi:hypothetical protein
MRSGDERLEQKIQLRGNAEYTLLNPPYDIQ